MGRVYEECIIVVWGVVTSIEYRIQGPFFFKDALYCDRTPIFTNALSLCECGTLLSGVQDDEGRGERRPAPLASHGRGLLGNLRYVENR